jgi:hypothetical protein
VIFFFLFHIQGSLILYQLWTIYLSMEIFRYFQVSLENR